MRRVSRTRLLQLAGALSRRERRIVESVSRFGLLSHAQVQSLFFSSNGVTATDGRQARRELARLVEGDVLARLERRVGGRRAGSAGYIYRSGPVGQRLAAYWRGEGLPRGRRLPEPGSLFVRHKLSIADIYVELVDLGRQGGPELVEFACEPDCWRTYLSGLGEPGYVKPDAFVRLGRGSFEDRLFVESDLGTEGRGALARKVRAYVDYFQSGTEQAEAGVFPLVLWLVPDTRRAKLLIDVCSELEPEQWRLFAVITRGRLRCFVSEERQPGEEPESAEGVGGRS